MITNGCLHGCVVLVGQCGPYQYPELDQKLTSRKILGLEGSNLTTLQHQLDELSIMKLCCASKLQVADSETAANLPVSSTFKFQLFQF